VTAASDGRNVDAASLLRVRTLAQLADRRAVRVLAREHDVDHVGERRREVVARRDFLAE
jgi:hypothetical protein